MAALAVAACANDVDIETEDQALAAPPYDATVVAAPSLVELGQNVTVTWTAPDIHSPNDWVGMFKVDAPDNRYVTWKYVGGAGQTSGELLFTVPLTVALDTGPFDFRYFSGGVKLDTSNAVTGYAEYAITDTPATVELGQQVSGTWHAPLAHSPNDYVTLAKVGTPDTSYVTYQYVGNAGQTSGRLTFTVPLTPALDPGPYELRYFFSGRKTATSAPIAGHAEYAVSAEGPCRAGVDLPTSWLAPLAHSPNDTVGIFRAGVPNGAAYSWNYVGGAGSRTGTTTLRGFNGGDLRFELRYMFGGRVTAVSESFACIAP